MATISLCMIVKNEEKNLQRCLNSVKDLVDEIVIVDTGSTDNTKLIAKRFTDKLFDFTWQDDFSLARNFSFSKASCDYILWLDADDVIPKATYKYLSNLKPSLAADVYMLKYDIACVGKKSTFSYYRERIIKNCEKAFWNGVVHECITPFGIIVHLPISILHKKTEFLFSDRNLKIYENALKIRDLLPREQYYYGRELFDHKKYKKCIMVLEKFISSKKGWKENVIDSLFILSICYNNIKKPGQSLNSLFKTFMFDSPRANVCNHIGNYFFNIKEYKTAISWYNIALKCKDTILSGGFSEPLYKNYYPYLQLSCCYYYLNDISKAISYNEKAGKYLNSDAVKLNRAFYQQLINN